MAEPGSIPLETRIAQGKASDPEISAWVSANAGSGKTFVLARRVIRLLLAGAKPSQILCLTFTKAAAAEMANRVFNILGQWVAMTPEALAKALGDMLERPATKRELSRARTLFALSLDSPGGLKIQTIHAFCEALLHQFPLEANVSGHFEVIDDARRDQLIAEARRQVMQDMESGGDQAGLRDALDTLIELASDDAIDKGLDAIIARRDAFLAWTDGDLPTSMAPVWRHTGFEPGEDEASVILQGFGNSLFDDRELERLAGLAVSAGRSTNEKFAVRIEEFLRQNDPVKKFAIRNALFMTQKFEPKALSSILTQAVTKHEPGLADALIEEAGRVQAAFRRHAAWKVLSASAALFTLGENILQHYMRLKRRGGLADFSDLVSSASNLLTRSAVRHWVQYKLDRGIDHLLVDEAQDTSPAQWAIINALSSDFHAGEGATGKTRTVFAVGDEKQSIYSFQGADPRKFAQEASALERRAMQSGQGFEKVGLNLSFRSTPDVLGAVDRVFANADNARGLGSGAAGTTHEAIRRNDPGEVLVWPLIGAETSPPQTDWLEPLDRISVAHPAEQLAARIAGTIAQWIGSGEKLPGRKEPLKCGDILILVRRRDVFSTAIIRHLKERGLAIAGADRLKLTQHIAIEDLVALGRAMLMPEDDLSLAALLKSPLFGVSDDELTQLAIERDDEPLFEHLELLAGIDNETGRQAAAIHTCLVDWRALSQRLAPYQFYAEILGAKGGRRKFMARLGTEAEDVLDAFEQAALDHSANGGKGLEDFIATLSRSSPEIKREVDMREDEIRVITVHSAKGLEAPLVFLVDPCNEAFSSSHLPALAEVTLPDDQNGFLWAASGRKQVDLLIVHDEIARVAGEEEYRRLLYVGMTRAADRLVVCGWHKSRKTKSPHWHSMVSEALSVDWTQLTGPDDEVTWRWTLGTPEAPKPADEGESTPERASAGFATPPAWLLQHAPAELPTPRPLTPSLAASMLGDVAVTEVGGVETQDAAAVQSSLAARSAALLRGTLTHRLLQYLPDFPAENRPAMAHALLAGVAGEWPQVVRNEVVGEVLAVIDRPDLAFLFSENSKAEASVAGYVTIQGKPVLVAGQIDRLSVSAERISIADFKTNRVQTSQILRGYALQLALYRALLMQIHPGVLVDCHLVWTREGSVSTLDHKELDAALEAFTFAKMTND